MDKQQKIEILLAMSHLIHTFSERRMYGGVVDKIMPFLALHTNVHSLAQGKFYQANRLVEMTWSDAHITHVTNKSNQHTELTKATAYKSTRVVNEITGANNYPGSIGINHVSNSFYTADVSSAGPMRSGYSSITTTPASSQLTTSGYTQRYMSELVKDCVSTEVAQQSIINRSMAYRPFFSRVDKYRSVNYRKKEKNQKRTINVSRDLNPHLTGLLNGISNNRNVITRAKFIANQNLYTEYDDSSATNRDEVSDVKSLNVNHLIDGVNKVSQNVDNAPVIDFNHANVNGCYRKASYGVAKNNISKPLSDLPVSYDMYKNTVENKYYNSRAYEIHSNPPIIYSRKKQQQSLSDCLHESSLNKSTYLSDTIERIVDKKVKNDVRLNAPVTENLTKLQDEVLVGLRPETLVTDEMVRVILKKLQQVIQEERFRIGLLS